MITFRSKILVIFIYAGILFLAPWSFSSKLYIGVLVWFYCLQATWSKRDKLQIYFGVPGSGKTTFAAWYAKMARKQNVRVLSNVPIKGTFKLDRSDIGKYHIASCLMLIDEGSIHYNNRSFKSFKSEENEWWSLHRHYKTEPIILSQGASDVDKRLRTLAQGLYHVQQSLIPYFIVRKEIRKVVAIDQMTHDIVDGYEYAKFGTRYIFSPTLWKMFDSFDAPRLPDKPGGWQQWYHDVSADELVTDAEGNVLTLNVVTCEESEALTSDYTSADDFVTDAEGRILYFRTLTSEFTDKDVFKLCS